MLQREHSLHDRKHTVDGGDADDAEVNAFTSSSYCKTYTHWLHCRGTNKYIHSANWSYPGLTFSALCVREAMFTWLHSAMCRIMFCSCMYNLSAQRSLQRGLHSHALGLRLYSVGIADLLNRVHEETCQTWQWQRQCQHPERHGAYELAGNYFSVR